MGCRRARKVRRALILRKADEGYSDAQIADALDIGAATVSRTRKRFVEEGLPSALNERPRLGQPRRLSGALEERLAALASGDPPEDHDGWTLRLLADKAVELGLVDSISHETVRQILKRAASR